MDEQQQRHQIIPATSFRLSKLISSDSLLKNFPTYVSEVVSDGTMTSLDGKLNGQPFRASWPPAMYIGHPEQPIYLRLEFPQQGINFYERTSGTEGPSYVINYTQREPEERDEARRKAIGNNLHARSPAGRYVFDTDQGIDVKDLEKLKAIAAYLKPTLRMWRKIGEVNAVKLINSHGKGTLDSLVVPGAE